MPDRTIEYVKLTDITEWEENPKDHDIGAIVLSIRRFGFQSPLLVNDGTGVLMAGHGRLEALRQMRDGREVIPDGIRKDGADWLVPVVRGAELTAEEAAAYSLADNRLVELGGWHEDELAGLLARIGETGDLTGIGWDEQDVADLLQRQLNPFEDAEEHPTLADRFLVPPFSVFDARQGYWQERKRMWLTAGIKSELGRGRKLLDFSEQATISVGSGRALPAKSYQRRKRATMPSFISARQAQTGQEDVEDWVGSSIFDPVLCEIVYRWFCPLGGKVLDPMAGGSVRGIVASILGREYVGIDLSAEQIEANREQAEAICQNGASPNWIVGDGLEVAKLAPGEYDLFFTCPPYGDLEVYSDDPRDLSTMDYPTFLETYRRIIIASLGLLKNDRFACICVGDIRDKKGLYQNFVSDTIAAFEDGGAPLYNEAILVTVAGSLPVRAGKAFTSGRKLGKTHQNVLVFIKGDWRKATKACGQVEVAMDIGVDDGG